VVVEDLRRPREEPAARRDARRVALVGGESGQEPLSSQSDPQYGAAIQAHAEDLFGSGDDAFFSLIDSAALEHLIGLDPHQLAPVERTRIERVLDLAVWIDMYKPTIVF
jgi:asparagine synthase (glutamine-hydrolysing)